MDVQRKPEGACRQASPFSDDGGDFRRELAHKLGNLLQVVNGNLELLGTRIEDERLRNYLANAQAAASELNQIAHSLVAEAKGNGS